MTIVMQRPLGAWNLHPCATYDGVGGALVAGGGVVSSSDVAGGLI